MLYGGQTICRYICSTQQRFLNMLTLNNNMCIYDRYVIEKQLVKSNGQYYIYIDVSVRSANYLQENTKL